MTVHLIKLCVGCDSIEDLRQWQDGRMADARRRRKPLVLEHWTRSMPRRRDEVLDGGSLYWVIKGYVRVRQPIVGLEERADADGRGFCAIRYAPTMVLTEPRMHRPFQGWRYLEAADSPADIGVSGLKRERGLGEEPSPEMLAELRSLGLL